MEIPQSIQDILRCSECNELLSCGPVFLVHETSAAICGRCSPQESSTSNGIRNRTRNIQYEATAKLLSFPCKYSNQGCNKKLNFSSEEPNIHEIDCDFRPLICPLVDRYGCDWIGTPRDLNIHCRDAHPSHLMENNSSVPKPDLTKSHLTNYLITAYNLIFLLHFKVCMSTGKLYHSVRMIGDSGLLGNFSYCLEIIGNNKNLTERGLILPRGIMILQEPTANYITINSLMDILHGEYDEAKFTIKIQTSLIKCQKCLETIDPVSDSMFCEECQKKLNKCKFTGKGCQFVAFNKSKCDKHEDFFCEYQTECFICDVKFVGGSLIEHLTSLTSCRKTIKSSINSVVRLIKINSYHNYIIFSCNNIGTIICSYNLSNSNLELFLYASLAWHELKKLKCSMELIDPQTKLTKILTPQIIDYSKSDWSINEEINDFPSAQNIGIDLILKINK